MIKNFTLIILFSFLFITNLFAKDKPVGITAGMMEIVVEHQGKKVTIQRNQDNTATINNDFALTSRPCPPFCIQPTKIAKDVETITELDVIDYLKKISQGNKNITLIDSRTPDWVAKGTIPGSINVPWNQLNPKKGATTEEIVKIMIEIFSVKLAKDKEILDVDEAIAEGDTKAVFNFSEAKTLILFCNGMWCGQSPVSIKTLLKFGYPAEKIKYFRGGMQTWHILGLTTVE